MPGARHIGLAGAALLAAACCAAGAAPAPPTQPTSKAASQPTSLPASQPATLPAVHALTGELTLAGVQERRRRVEAAADLSAEVKKRLEGIYDKIAQELTLAEKLAAEAAQQAEQTAQLRATAAGLKQKLAEAATQPVAPQLLPTTMPDANSVGEAELADLLQSRHKQLQAAEAELAARRKTAATAGDSLKLLDGRLKTLTARTAEISRRQEELAAQLSQPPAPPESEPAEVAAAAKQLLLAEKKHLQEEAELLRREQDSLPLRREVLEAEKALADRQVAATERVLEPLRRRVETLQRIRDQRTEKAKEQALAKAASEHPVVAQLAAEDLALTRLLVGADGQPGLREKIGRVEGQLAAARQQTAKVERDAKSIEEKVRAVGMTDAIGLLMRQQRSLLPDPRAIRGEIVARQGRIVQAELERLGLRDRLAELSDLDGQVAAWMAKVPAGVQGAQRQRIEALVRQHLEAIRKTLAGEGQTKGLVTLYDKYAADLNELDVAQTRLIARTRQFAAYIDEHVLWIRSAPPLGPAELRNVPSAAAWLLSPVNWLAAAEALGQDFLRHPVLDSLLVAALAALAAGAPWLRRWRDRERPAHRWTGAAVVEFLWAQAVAAAVGLRWPLLLLAAGWRMGRADEAAAFARAVAAGLSAAGLFYLPLALLRAICRPGGLGEAQFGWPSDALARGRALTGRVAAVGVPLTVAIVTLEGASRAAWASSLGRALFVLGFAALGAAAAWVLRPHGQLMQQNVLNRRDTLRYRLRAAWLPLVVAVPWALAVIAAMGYYYTAVQLAWRVLGQAWLLMGLLVAHGLLRRWVVIARQIATTLARWRVAEKGEEPPEQRLGRADEQTARLLRYAVALGLVLGTWGIWAAVLPALSIVGRVVLWRTSYGAAGQAVPVTLGDVFLAIVIFLATLAVTRNVAGILEITVLHRLNVSSGARYAIVAIARYAAIVVGIVSGFYAIGVTWAHVQWIVAAVGLGLGFGLQEIFANFVSGLILLLERPIRVGDVVTVGNVSGTVANIRMRATTIVDWDRKELVVPNKEFITGQLVNWSLSDEVIRVVVKVGIAYGSDTRKARELLLKAARDNPRVLGEPAPSALFLEFGGSSLNFELRVFVTGRNDYLAARDELHQAIDDAFREAGITIAFPQLDLHVIDVPPRDARQSEKTGDAP